MTEQGETEKEKGRVDVRLRCPSGFQEIQIFPEINCIMLCCTRTILPAKDVQSTTPVLVLLDYRSCVHICPHNSPQEALS